MKLSATQFNRHLAHIGQQVRWAQSWACPCINPASGQPDTRCPHCLGKGYMWPSAIDTVCGLSGQKTQQQWMASGGWAEGDVVVTIPGDSPMWQMGQYDRMTMLNGTERFSTSLTRGSPTERLLFRANTVERIFWIAANKAIVEGAIPSVDPIGRPIWASGAAEPPAGTSYSISGTRRPEYYCLMELPSNRNEHSGEPLPKRVVLRRFDLLGRRGG